MWPETLRDIITTLPAVICVVNVEIFHHKVMRCCIYSSRALTRATNIEEREHTELLYLEPLPVLGVGWG